MKVRWLLRPQAKPGISIEQVFENLRPFFPSEIHIEVCKLPGTGNLKTDAILQRRFIKNLPAVDLTHVLGDVHYTAAWIKGKQVHTYHDIDSLLQGKSLIKKIKQYFWIQYPLKKASAVSCISTYTANRLKEIVPKAQNKILVIHNALAPRWQNISLKPKGNFMVLSVGTKENKNLLRCAEAIQGIKGLKWQIIGKENKSLTDAIKRYKLDCTFLQNVSEAKLRVSYQQATVLLFPSLYEGFGLPIIEAQACGTAVITSNGTSMPEIAGKGAIFVDPLIVDEIRTAVFKLKDDVGQRQKLVKNGKLNIQRFEIEKIAKEYIFLYKSVLNAV